MNRNIYTAFVFAIGMTWSMSALAQTPPEWPAHDYAVAYMMTSPGKNPEQVNVYYQAASQLSRSEMPLSPASGYSILNKNAGTMLTVMPSQRMYGVIPLGSGGSPSGLDKNAQMVKGATQRILNLSCTEWTTMGPQGASKACITGDGLPLATQSPSGATMIAHQVKPGALSNDLFKVPAGFQQMPIPNAEAYGQMMMNPSPSQLQQPVPQAEQQQMPQPMPMPQGMPEAPAMPPGAY
jgi:hypothetical protein